MQAVTPTPTTPTAVGLSWTAQLTVGNARMDETHAEFVDQLTRIFHAPSQPPTAVGWSTDAAWIDVLQSH